VIGWRSTGRLHWGWFIAFAAAGLLLCMALPGWHLMRTNRYATVR